METSAHGQRVGRYTPQPAQSPLSRRVCAPSSRAAEPGCPATNHAAVAIESGREVWVIS